MREDESWGPARWPLPLYSTNRFSTCSRMRHGAGREEHHVAGHHLNWRNVVRGSVSEHLRLDLDQREQQTSP